MTQENKSLLLKDLCGRLPYGVKIQVKEWAVLDTELKVGHIDRLQNNDNIELKPYLHPMSSMTEEERKQLDAITVFNGNVLTCITGTPQAFDFLNAHHFDYRGLIPKGLAIAVTKENNPYKE